MKKILQTILFLLFTTGITCGQDIIYTVSGELNNQKVPLDSIMVENLSNNTWMTFNNLPDEQYYQINLTKKAFWGTVGIDNFNSGAGFIEVQNLPGSMVLSFRKNTPERINLSIYNIAGQKIYSESNKLINPGNSIKVQPGATGVYLVKIETPQGTQSFKVIGQTLNNGNQVEVLDGNQVITPTKSASFSVGDNFSFNTGDSIRVSVYKLGQFSKPELKVVGISDNLKFKFDNLDDSLTVLNGKLNFPELPNFEFSGLIVESMVDSASVRLNGTYQVKNEVSDEIKVPILFSKGDKLVFGIYPSLESSNSITLDDIFLFYVKLYPDVILQGLNDSELKELISSDSNSTECKIVLSEILNSNEIPSDNESFINLLNISASSIVQSKKIQEKSVNSKVGQLQYSFTRDGKIKWPSQLPTFAYIGMEIRNLTNDKVVYGTKYFGTNQFSIPAIVKQLTEIIFYGRIQIGIKEFELNEPGQYQISFTNGKGYGLNSEFRSEVSEQNAQLLAVTALLYTLPIGTKEITKGKCNKKYHDLVFALKNDIIALSSGSILDYSFLDFSSFLLKFTTAISGVTEECTPIIAPSYFKKIIDVVEKLTLVTETSTFWFIFKDFVLNTISGTEIRNFYDNVSFGELEYKNVSTTEFKGNPDSEHYFEADVKEKIYSYDIIRGLKTTEFEKIEEIREANELPFKATLIKGDAKVIDANPKIQIGLYCEILMGKDTSEVKIEPAFSNSKIEPVIVTLKPTPLYIGTWEAIEQNGFPIGTKIMGVGRLYCKIAPIYISEGALTSFICKFDSEKVTLTAIWADLLKKEYTLGRTEDSICYPKFTGKTYLEKNFSQVFSYTYKFDSQEGIQLLNPLTNEYAKSIIEFIINENQRNEMIIDFRNTYSPEFGMLKLIRKE